MSIDDPRDKLARARSALIRVQPFFGTLALRLKIQEIDHPKIPVMGTDGITLYYNAEAVRKMPQPEVIGVVMHEVLHCAFQHMFRRRHRDNDKWNRAADYVINSIILKERYSLPESRLFNSKYDNMSAEEVYEKLPNQPPSSGNGPGGGNWNFGSSLDPNSPNPKTGKTQSASSISANAKDWEIATKQAAHLAKQQGTLPGHLETLIDELLQPQIPWREQLWRFFNQRKPDRITWNKPNRRMIAQGIYMPSRRFVPTGDIVVAVDTSGSVSEDELQHFASEIKEIHKALAPRKLYVADVDTEIQDRVKEYTQYETPEFTYKGRGGTNFEPVFQWIEENNIQVDAVVYLTDGYASWPKEVPNYPVLWCITNHEVVPEWGEHLILEI
jgi:predicted metal-dependent peptidase